MTAITIASVYVRGHRKAYAPDWVARLHAAAQRNADGLVLRHVCLTDQPDAVRKASNGMVETIDISAWWKPLRDAGLKGWWAKVKLFDSKTFTPGERILAIDIDNIIVASLRPFVEEYADRVAIMAPHTAPNFNPPGTVNNFSSTVMMWTHGNCIGAMRDAYDMFGPHVAKKFRGDQDWLGYLLEGLPTFDNRYMMRMPRGDEKRPPEGCVFVVGGKVKPDVAAKTRSWVAEAWRV